MSSHDDVHSENRFAFVLGTRPEMIKLAPLIRECQERDQEFILIHTGQHYSDSLDSVFFDQLELPTPDYHLGVGSASHGEQTGKMLIEIEEVLLENQPDVVFVQGDTNSVLAGAIASSKLNCELAHVEAGLRSFDREMPEETNRVVADHVADYLFAPTEQSRKYLQDEGIDDDRIFVTGNTIVDAVQQHREFAAKKSNVLKDFGLKEKSFGLLTAHRAENVDDPDRFASLLEGVSLVAAKLGTEIIYPIHPRAKERLNEFDLSIPEAVTLVEPQDYLDFLNLEGSATLVLTDSGGVQEEACILGVPCVTLRDNTERPETLEVGANELAGVDSGEIMKKANQMLSSESNWENPFGDGTTAEQILEIVTDTS